VHANLEALINGNQEGVLASGIIDRLLLGHRHLSAVRAHTNAVHIELLGLLQELESIRVAGGVRMASLDGERLQHLVDDVHDLWVCG